MEVHRSASKLGVIGAMAAIGAGLNARLGSAMKSVGLTKAEVEEARKHGRGILYGMRTAEKNPGLYDVLIDSADKPYRRDARTGTITRMFDKGVPKDARSKAHRINKRQRTIAVCNYFHAPKNVKLSKARLESLEAFIVEREEIKKVAANVVVEPVKRTRKPALKSKEVSA